MPLVNCHECSSPVSSEAPECPKCGARFHVHEVLDRIVKAAPEPPSGLPKVIGIFLVIIVPLVLGPWAWSWYQERAEQHPVRRVTADNRVHIPEQTSLKPGSNNPRPGNVPTKASTTSPIISSESIPVRSDPTARYTVIAKVSTSPMILITQRTGVSGTSFAKREIDCSDRSARYLGLADTLEDLNNQGAEPKRTVPVAGSITAEIVAYACSGVQ